MMFETLFARFRKIKRTPEELALIEAILDDPESDAKRLQYAAWLRKRGEPLGELIELEIEADRLELQGKRGEANFSRINELMDKHGKRWLAPLKVIGLQPKIGSMYLPFLWFEKGVISSVEVQHPGILPEKLDRFFAAAPLVQYLLFTYDPVDVLTLSESPHLARLRHLHLQSIALDDLESLTQSPYTDRLIELSFYGNLGIEGARLLAEWPRLQQLRKIALTSCGFGDDALKVLCESGRLGNLEELELRNNCLESEGVRTLAQTKLPRLKMLDLSGNSIDAEACQLMAATACWPRLESLTLNGAGLDAEAAMALASHWSLATVQSLDLTSNNIEDAGLNALVHSDKMQGVCELHLGGCSLGDETITTLVSATKPGFWRLLALGHNELSPESMEVLASWRGLENLESLDLTSNPIGDQGIRALARSPYLKNLRKLDLYGTGVGDAGFTALASSKGLPALKQVSMFDSDLSPANQALLEERFDD